MSAHSKAGLRRRAAASLALCAATMYAAAAPPWPQVDLPAGAHVYQVDAVTVVNGLPVRMQGFVSGQPQADVAAWFRQRLGKDLVENRLGNKLILGQARGEYFITIQLETVAQATRAIIAVAHLTAGIGQRADTDAANSRLLARLPSGTRVVSRITSVDGPRSATHVVLSNHYDERLNGEQLARMLRDQGMQLEHLASGAQGNGKTLFFKGKGQEAMAVVTRGRDGQTTIVLNTTTFMENYK